MATRPPTVLGTPHRRVVSPRVSGSWTAIHAQSSPSSHSSERNAESGPASVRRRSDGVQESIPGEVAAAFNSLREQQKKLQASSARIEEMLKKATTEQECRGSKRDKLPRELSEIVRDAYKKMVDEEEDIEWNFMASFDDHTNREVNKSLLRNVEAVLKDSKFDTTTIKRAARTYFKSRKSAYHRKKSGISAATAAISRKRQRRHNKVHSRLRVLKQSKTLAIDDSARHKIMQVLKPEFMSSEESAIDEDTNSHQSSSGSDDESHHPASVGRKKLVKHKLPWRSQEMQAIIDSLDRKLDRRRSDRARAMCLDVEMGADSTRPAPDNLPEWARELFS